jgi:acyl-CoA thioesterase
MGFLGEALSLRSDGPARWLAYADPDHESVNAMFGGWTAGVTLGSVMRSAAEGKVPTAMTVNFVKAITPDQDVTIEVRRLGGGRSIEHWRADVRPGSDDAVLASATAVLTNRPATDSHSQFSMPTVPEPETLDEFHAPGPQGQQTMIHLISGEYGSGDSSSSHWMRDLSGRRLDHVQLAYLADQNAPRSFFWGAGPRFSATLTMAVYFLASADEIEAAGDDYLLAETVGSRGYQAISDQLARIWSREGALLATTHQLCWYL